MAGEKTGLAGRIDNAAHDAAVAKVSEAFSHAQEIRSHLELILASEAFRNSRRCQEFVSHIVEHALTGDFELLRLPGIVLGPSLLGRVWPDAAAFVLPPTTRGNIDASATRSPSTPRTRSCGSTTAAASTPMLL